MKKYIVSLVIKKPMQGGLINIVNCLNNNIDADSKHEAFGIYYDRVKKEYPEHDLHTHIEMEIDA
jgi:hypothetical protein